MSEQYPPSIDDQEMNENFPPFKLVDYFRSQFADGYKKQHSEGTSGINTDNGEFVRTVPLEDPVNGSPLTRGTHRVILKPPHPKDLSGFYCEVFALFSSTEEVDEPGSHAETFVVRDFTNGRPGPFWMADAKAGVTSTDFDLTQIIAVEGDTLYSDSIDSIEIADSMFD